MSKLESEFERKWCKEFKKLHPDIRILKGASSMVQGIPDRLVLFHGRFAMLEFKRSANAKHRPNQNWYVDMFNKQDGYAAFVYPENGETVFEDLIEYFGL